jgi:anti-sigma B factor antagonist
MVRLKGQGTLAPKIVSHARRFFMTNRMQIETEEHIRRIVVVRPKGRVDAFHAPVLRAHLDQWLSDGVADLIIDLSLVEFLDSAGMAVLVNSLKRARLAGGDIRLVWPVSEDARRILSLTRFDRVFEMLDSADSGLQG